MHVTRRLQGPCQVTGMYDTISKLKQPARCALQHALPLAARKHAPPPFGLPKTLLPKVARWHASCDMLYPPYCPNAPPHVPCDMPDPPAAKSALQHLLTCLAAESAP